MMADDLIINEKAETPSELLKEMETFYIFFSFISLQVKCLSVNLFENQGASFNE